MNKNLLVDLTSMLFGSQKYGTMRMKILRLTGVLVMSITNTLIAQIGKPFIHDPSTVVECDGKYYTFGTGGGGLISEDGWTWNGGGIRPGGGAAPLPAAAGGVARGGDVPRLLRSLAGSVRCIDAWSFLRHRR